jgi:uncharacterized protein (DUF2267 family)
MADDTRQARQEQRGEVRAQQTFARFIEDIHRRTHQPLEQCRKATVIVLCTLEQRLFGRESEHLHAQLPRKLQELVDACPRSKDSATVHATGPEFIQAVALVLGTDYTHAEWMSRAVLATLREHISPGEAQDVESQLPPDLWSLWALES